LIFFDAVHGALGAAGAPGQGEAGGDGVEVVVHAAGEAGQSGQVIPDDDVDPVRELGAEAAGEDLSEVADVLVGRLQFGVSGQDRFEWAVRDSLSGSAVA
jgi:hypothetical protein